MPTTHFSVSKSFVAIALLFFGLASMAQKKGKSEIQRPKLVIGIVVDQMRADYVYRFAEYYGEGGFKRFLRQGFDCRNTNYNYVPTYTGPGHAAIYTGSVPAFNGIISNDWYDRSWGKVRYCVSDPNVKSVGTEASTGKMSPASLLSTTVTDELRLSNNKQSKVIGVCLKDRGSVLPAGHMPTGAYWFDNTTGNFVTSSFYADDLPQWVKDFNAKKLPDFYLSKPWETVYPIERYKLGLADGDDYRNNFKGETTGKFPHNLPEIRKNLGYELLRKIPMGNTFTLDFALEAIQKENLGKGKYTDFLALSFSSTDYVGHQFGINAIELQDTYVRLDKDLERLFSYIDKNIGMENVLIFLSADHGAAQTPDYLTDNGVPAGFLPETEFKKQLNEFVSENFGKGDWIEDYGSQQIYLNYKTIDEKKADVSAIVQKLRQYVKKLPGIQEVWDIHDPEAIVTSGNEHHSRIANGIHPKRSGDIAIMLQPGWLEGEYSAHKGTTHGSGWSYDTHVPLLWLGWKIRNGSSSAPVYISDIAPTVSDLLHISFPNATVGKPISDMILKK
ncbi:alkaline phosphatase PafA [Flavobacterium selenitireducens]|uniref:alkaline phosphatase PafA n=1 Tax=Flavobacterium selenitireducens TaxID=2722704 RepID=UPI00168AAAA0|nr:alkaline phosphatase PafA [Flavobacterium selenitireducens]MBD3584085.1 alkaline phosphatase family protein [Flavobacterium selenitireducens]